MENQELEDKLEILHQCLVGDGAKDALTDARFEKLFETPEVKELVAKLSKMSDCLAEEYINTLTELRILLLGS